MSPPRDRRYAAISPQGATKHSGRPVVFLESWRWSPWLVRARRLAIAAAILSAIGYLSNPTVSPLMCKVYG
ncbi:hypothetical protein [Sulfurisoma sediminicola]|uniref:hypothetical protein n=1 Tax=Sulfurisoma sediminicola TaxID=1381557 RepID=UPI000F61054E|nr:hypothetical protein [Sulfurisoma sediminicola]